MAYWAPGQKYGIQETLFNSIFGASVGASICIWALVYVEMKILEVVCQEKYGFRILVTR